MNGQMKGSWNIEEFDVYLLSIWFIYANYDILHINGQ